MTSSQQDSGFLASKTTLWNRRWLSPLLLAALIILAYQPAWQAGFIWDDDYHLTSNPCIVGPLGFKAIWTSTAALYYPLVVTSFWIQHGLWGLNPMAYHLFNIVMHSGCAILLWRVLLNLEVPGAWFGAALWALHPVQTESVAWITEIKNTQSCLFYLLAVLLFLKWRPVSGSAREKSKERYYALALFCSTLAILSKSSTVMLPVVLGLCWWWMDGQWRWRYGLRLAPFLLISLAASGWTIWEQQFHAGAVGHEWTQSLAGRFIIAGKDFWFYLGKLVWPHPLIFIYPRWEINPAYLAAYLPVLAVLVWLFILWRNPSRKMSPTFFAFAYFSVSLFPILGFFNVYFFRYSYVADHFQYLASAGPLALIGAGISKALGSSRDKRPWLEPTICGMVLLVCGMLTWRQGHMYKDMETLWRTTLSRNQNAFIAHNNLGVLVLDQGKTEEAVAHFQKALELDPDYVEAHNNLGLVFLERGQMKEAFAHFQAAVTLRPDYAEGQNSLGNALFKLGQMDNAIPRFKKAVEINPRFALARYNLGNTLFQQGRLDEAISQLQKAVEIRPNYVDAHYNLGIAFFQKGREEEASIHLEKALELRPDFADAHNNLGNLLFRRGQLNEAAAHYEKALEIQPGNAAAHSNLGRVLLSKNQITQAIDHFRRAVELQPDRPEPHNELAIVLLRNGSPEEASTHLRKALTIQPKNAFAHQTLGQVLFQEGKFNEAIDHYQAALSVRPADVPTLNNLAWVLATCPQSSLRNGVRSIELAEQANRISGDSNPSIIGTLAAAYAEAGRFSEAVSSAQHALDLATTGTNNAQANSLRTQLELYRARAPFRDEGHTNNASQPKTP